jgi:hypothetical protein
MLEVLFLINDRLLAEILDYTIQAMEDNHMDKIINCCGAVCSECKHFLTSCKGCPESKGKAFWLEYTGEDICEIYDCCNNKRHLEHCGKCASLPCERYFRDDPTKSHEENAEDRRKQLEQLKSM